MSNKYGDKYRVHNLVKFDYSQIGEYIDEYHTDRPLRNDELVDLLNEQEERIQELKQISNVLDKNISEYEEFHQTQLEDQSYNEAYAMECCVEALVELKKEIYGDVE